MENLDNSNSSIGKRIKALRVQHHLTQEQLGNLIGLNSKQISKIERGVTGVSIDNQIRLSSIFHCSIDYIVKGCEFQSVDSQIPSEMVEILLAPDCAEKDILKKYLAFYQKIRQNP